MKLTHIQSLRRQYFANKAAYRSATDEERACLPDQQAAVCKELAASVPASLADAVAFLDVAIADFEQFEMDDGTTPVAEINMGMQLAYLSMVHARKILTCTLWQPIETAPRDGRWFLAYRPPTDFGSWSTLLTVRWFADEELEAFIWPDGGYAIDPFTPSTDDDDWVKDGAFFEENRCGSFTHWMPLPSLPAGSGRAVCSASEQDGGSL